VHDDPGSVQRHRSTIVSCLRDPDISIRSRALELILLLVNESNVEELTTELLNYLSVAQAEQRRDLASEILRVVETFAPSKVWRIDTLITMLSLVGSNCDAR
jgi:AP-1 complex subunit gamma-1